MKGIAHFAAGVAVASCFPIAVRAGADGNPLYFILGGIFGILPDTIDFKFYRFFYRHDIEVIPDPNKPDPQMIADAVALSVNRAFETGKPVKIKLDTIRHGTDIWQRYTVKFDVSGRRVIVSYGPAVDTSGTPIPGTETNEKLSAEAKLDCMIKLDYKAATIIDILDGPMFRMTPDNNTVTPCFIPWHRESSHSFIIALLPALIGCIIWGAVAGFIIYGAYIAHILIDQLGFMGSNLFFPFSSGRTEGLKIIHSEKSFPNFAAVWISCLFIFWNLYCIMPFSISHFNLLKLFFYGAIIPGVIYLFLRRIA